MSPSTAVEGGDVTFTLSLQNVANVIAEDVVVEFHKNNFAGPPPDFLQTVPCKMRFSMGNFTEWPDKRGRIWQDSLPPGPLGPGPTWAWGPLGPGPNLIKHTR